jgi:hypothetical protein
MLFPLLMAGIFMLALWIETWIQVHYFAPAVALIMLVLLQCLRHASRWRWGQFSIGIGLGRGMVATFVVMALFKVVPLPTWMGRVPPTHGLVHRFPVMRKVESVPGPHLIIVHYAQNHDPDYEWVYNLANIDQARIVWARDMGTSKNQELLQYFKGRTAWVLQPDRPDEQIDRLDPK